MRKLVIIAVVGLAAQLVDGGLGMGYGVTSTSLLLSAAALTPAVASATVHLSELGTTAASGIAHWRLGNVDRNLVLRLGLPGAIGAFAGATVLSRLSTEAAAPIMAGLLLALGLGWAPCIGPTLAAITSLSWNLGDPGRAAILGLTYSLGLGIPFLLLAIGFGWASRTVGFLKRHIRAVNSVGGVLLIVLGLLMVTGLWTDLMSRLAGVVGSVQLPL